MAASCLDTATLVEIREEVSAASFEELDSSTQPEDGFMLLRTFYLSLPFQHSVVNLASSIATCFDSLPMPLLC